MLNILFFTLLITRYLITLFLPLMCVWRIQVCFFGILILWLWYLQLVQKSFARLLFNDFVRNARFSSNFSIHQTNLQMTNLFSLSNWFMECILFLQLCGWGHKRKVGPFCSLDWWWELPEPWSWEGCLIFRTNLNLYIVQSVPDGETDKWTEINLQASQQAAKPLYDAKVQPTTLVPKQVGNMYTASLYAAFASLIHNKHNTLVSFLATDSSIAACCLPLFLRSNSYPALSITLWLVQPTCPLFLKRLSFCNNSL